MTARGAEADGDDWSNVTDRTVKKRIQNRIAQRNYRKLVSIQMINQLNQINAANHFQALK
jgi:hypothetical protein